MPSSLPSSLRGAQRAADDVGSARAVALGTRITLEDLEAVARHGAEVRLDEGARALVERSRAAVDAIARAGDAAPNVYGVNTGFGALSETRISAADIRALQQNLVRSHSTGVGTPLERDEVRGIMLLRAQVLALGCSGVRASVLETLIAMLNKGVTARIPSQGLVERRAISPRSRTSPSR